MQHTTRTRLLAIVLLIVLFGPQSNAPSVEIHNADDIQMSQVAWALDRFEQAALTLPAIELTFHDGAGPCHGHPGLYRRRGQVAHIEICSPTNHTILHELAHAWEGASVSQAARDQFADHWGVDNWNDHSVPWADRGTERAADTVAFVLEGLPERPTAQLLRFVCGYSLLTGKSLPEAQTDECDETAAPGSHEH